jgi:hypothetical protein
VHGRLDLLSPFLGAGQQAQPGGEGPVAADLVGGTVPRRADQPGAWVVRQAVA